MKEKQSNKPFSGDPEINTPWLPRDSYRSKFTWTVNHAFMNHETFLVVPFACLGTYKCWKKLGGIFAIIYHTIFACFLIYLIYIELQRTKNSKLHLRERMDFLAEVIKIQPHDDMEKWDVVAENMNELFYNRGRWSTKEFFFDSKHCYDIFRQLLMAPYSEKALKKKVPLYLELKFYADEAARACQPGLDELKENEDSWKLAIPTYS